MPTIHIHDASTNTIIEREMTVDELAIYTTDSEREHQRQTDQAQRLANLQTRRAAVLRTRVSKAELADLPPRARTILEFLIDKIEHLELELALLRGENPTITPL